MGQTIVVIALFLIAGAFLGRRLYGALSGKEKPGCEKCAVNQLSKKA